MKRFFLTVLMALLVWPLTAKAAHHGQPKPIKKGILLVAFGSSIPAAQVSFANIDQRVRQAVPGVTVRWAYTSHIIRQKLAQQGQHLDSVAMALAKMMDEGFTHVAVQSLHTIRGAEFDDLVQTVHAFENMAGGFKRIIVGGPLLSNQKDMGKVVTAIIDNVPHTRKRDEAVLLMGHGSHHPSNAFYAALMFYLQRRDPNIFVGTVEGTPTIDDMLVMLKEKQIKKVYLMPFMSVAGDHARNDMAGDEDDSWKSILTRAGFKYEVILKGTAEYNNMVDIWIDHLLNVMAHLSQIKSN